MACKDRTIDLSLELVIEWGQRFVKNCPDYTEGDFTISLPLDKFDHLKRYGATYGNAA